MNDRSCMQRIVTLALISLSLVFLYGCSSGVLPTRPISVSLASNASSTTLDAGSSSVALTASVAYDSSNAGVSWTLVGCGTLAASGNTAAYTPPTSTSISAADCTVTITATSAASNTQTSSVTFTIMAISVSVSADATNISVGSSANLTAGIAHDVQSAGVTWKISNPADGSCGSITNAGTTSATYVAPNTATTCTATVVATAVTDSTKSASVQINVLGSYQPIRLVTQQQNIASGETGQVYAQTFVAQGGSGGFTWTITGNLPPGVAASTTNPAEIIGRPTTSGVYGITVQVTDNKLSGFSASQTYSFNIGNGLDYSNTGLFYGTYACYLQGHMDDGTPEAMVWSMKANGVNGGQGFIKSISLDVNSASGYSSGIAVAGSAPYPGYYSVGADMRGFLSFTINGSTSTFAIAIGNWQQVSSQQIPKTLATEARLTRIDDVGDGSSSFTASRRYGAGQCFRVDQNLVGVNPAATITGLNWVFGLSGANSANQPEAAGGLFSTCGGTGTTCGGTATSGFISNGSVDLVSGQTASSGSALTGSYTTDGNTANYYRFNMNVASGLPSAGWVMYLIGTVQPSGVQAPLKAFVMSTDPITTSGLLVGQLRSQQQSTYSAGNLNGPFVLYESAATVPAASGTPGYFTNLMQGTSDGAGNVTIQASVMNENGQAANTSNGTHSVSVASNGRLALGSSWLYLYDTNQAVLLDGASNLASQNVGLGWLEAQSAIAPSTAGQYFTGSTSSFDPGMSSQSGILTLNGAGNISLTQDSVGQGTASLGDIFPGLLSDWTSVSWPNASYGTFQIDNGGSAQMDCAVVSAAVSNAGSPVGRAICSNTPGQSLSIGFAGNPGITVLQQ